MFSLKIILNIIHLSFCTIGIDYSSFKKVTHINHSVKSPIKKEYLMFSNISVITSNENNKSIHIKGLYESTDKIKECELVNDFNSKNKTFKVKNYETPLNVSTLNSLYFNALNLPNASIYVSVHDYLETDTIHYDLRLVHLGVQSVVNESLAMVSYLSTQNKLNKVICINLRGHSLVITEYEINDESNDKEIKNLNEINNTNENSNQLKSDINTATLDENNSNQSNDTKDNTIVTEENINEKNHSKENTVIAGEKNNSQSNVSNNTKRKIILKSKKIFNNLINDKKIYEIIGDFLLGKIQAKLSEGITKEDLNVKELTKEDLNVKELTKELLKAFTYQQEKYEPLKILVKNQIKNELEHLKIDVAEFESYLLKKMKEELNKVKDLLEDYSKESKVILISDLSDCFAHKSNLGELWDNLDYKWDEYNIPMGLISLRNYEYGQNKEVFNINYFSSFAEEIELNKMFGSIDLSRLSPRNHLRPVVEKLIEENKKKEAHEKYKEALYREEYIQSDGIRRKKAVDELKKALNKAEKENDDIKEIIRDTLESIKQWYEENKDNSEVESSVFYDKYDIIQAEISYAQKVLFERESTKESMDKVKDDKKLQEDLEKLKTDKNLQEELEKIMKDEKFAEMMKNEKFQEMLKDDKLFSGDYANKLFADEDYQETPKKESMDESKPEEKKEAVGEEKISREDL